MEVTLLDIQNSVSALALKNEVQVTKGSLFHCNRKPADELHFRMTFAAALEEGLGRGVRIFADAVKEEFSIA